MRAILAAALAVIACAAEAPPAFEVASVKADPNVRIGSHFADSKSGTVTYRGHGLRDYIFHAYGLEESQVVGEPAWIDSDPWEILGKAAPGTPEVELLAMLQNLFAERFKLKMHRETKLRSTYLLMPAKKGPKLVPVANDDGPTLKTKPSLDRGVLNAPRASMPMLAHVLEAVLKQPVIDRTGLEGFYAVKLTWAPEDGQGREKEGTVSADPAPSLFTALQEQLGLIVRNEKLPRDILVIDSVEKPSGN